jgi:hypothetical protein
VTTEQSIAVGGAIVVAVLALIGAAWLWRSLGRAGEGLQATESGLAARATALPQRLAATRTSLADFQAQIERVLGSLANLDARIDAATTELGARRAASDSLRERLIAGHATLARVREIVHVLIRAIELRRIFLG